MALVGDIQLQDSAVKPAALDTSKKFSAEGLTATTAFAVTDAGAGSTVSTTGLITAKSSNDVNAWLQTTKSDGNVSLYLSNDARPDWALKVAGTASDAFVIGNSTGANDTCQYPAFSIGTAGAVGVGKTGASNILDITYRNSSTGGIVLTEATNSIASKFISEASSGSIGTTTNSKFGFRTNSATVGAFDTSGNFGIGTDAPGATLDVRGGAIFNEAGGAVDFRVEGDTEANLFFVDGSTDRIGVGTATPAVLFDIDEGDASCASVLMCVNGCICAVGYLGEKQGHTIEDAGVAETQRTGLNFVLTNVGCVVDDSSNDATVVCINGANTCVPFIMCDGSTSDPISLVGGSIGNQLSNDSNPTLGGLMCGGGNSICAVNCITITGCYFGDGSQLTGVSSVPSSFSGDCTIIGCNAGGNVAAGGASIVLIGANAGYNATTPSNVVVLGSSAALCMTTATDTVLIGTGSGRCVLTCAGNLALGAWSLYNECAGSFNTALGTCAGLTQKGATTNTFVGAYAGTAVSTGSGNVFVGYKAGCAATTGNCCLIIGNGTCDLITGVFNTGIVSLVSCVGIGTAAPDKELDVFGTAAFGNATGYIYVGNNGQSFSFNRDPTDGSISNSSAHAYQFQQTASATPASDYLTVQVYDEGGTEVSANAFTINGAGNIGIGTATPGYLLDTFACNATYAAKIQNVTGGDGLYIKAGGSSSEFALAVNNFDDSVGILSVKADGNIGIGTAAPDGPLHVFTASAGVTAAAAADELILENSAAAGLTILSGTSSTGSIFMGDADSNQIGRIQYNHAGNCMIFSTSAAEQMVIDSSGNVGIGTTAPDSQLHIESSASDWPVLFLENTNADATGGALVFRKYGASPADNDAAGEITWQAHNSAAESFNVGEIQALTTDVTDSTEDGALLFKTMGGGTFAEKMRLSATGNLGIGTTALDVGYNLHIYTSSGNAYGYIQTAGTNGKATLLVANDAQAYYYGVGDDDKLHWGAGTDPSYPKMTMDSSGKIGIGTATPGTNLHLTVSGSAQAVAAPGMMITNSAAAACNVGLSLASGITGKAYIFLGDANDDAAAQIWYDNNTDDLEFNAGEAAGQIIFKTASTERMKLNDYGGLCIPTAINGCASLELGTAGVSNGLITAPEAMYFSIDSNNDQSDRAYYFGHNANTTSATTLMTIRDNGCVGIGTATPSTELHVYAVAGNVPALCLNGSGTSCACYGPSWSMTNSTVGTIFTHTDGNGCDPLYNWRGATAEGDCGQCFYIRFKCNNAYKPGGGDWAASSDCRLKCCVESIWNFTSNTSTCIIQQLNPVSFYWDQDGFAQYHMKGVDGATDDGTCKRFGFIAQEYCQILPGRVDTMDPPIFCNISEADGGPILGMDRGDLFPYLAGAVKELDCRIKELEDCVISLGG